jgi:uncharacterized protein involved in exopolysaccharide biosynthesis
VKVDTPVGRSDTPTPRTSSATPSTKFSDRMRSSLALDKTKSNLPAVNDGNIVVVTKLREEINSLKKQISTKNAELIEKDKQASMLKVNHLREIRTLQEKFKNTEEDYLNKVNNLRSKNAELLRKVAQISKGKL